MLIALLNNESMVAEYDLDRTQEYKCPGCNGEVILKAGNIKIPHFSHRPDSQCGYGAGETLEHEQTKKAIWQNLKAAGYTASMEFNLYSAGINRRADILADINSIPVAIEIQHSQIPTHIIDSRTADYNSAGIYVVWVYVGDNVNTEMAKHFQKKHGGTLLRSYPNLKGLISPVRLQRKQKYIPLNEFYIPEGRGETAIAGGYTKKLKGVEITDRYPLINPYELSFSKNRLGELVGFNPFSNKVPL